MAEPPKAPHGAGADPSMEDILASIRRILSEDETPPASPAAPPSGASDVLVLDPSMLVPEMHDVPETAPTRRPNPPPMSIRRPRIPSRWPGPRARPGHHTRARTGIAPAGPARERPDRPRSRRPGRQLPRRARPHPRQRAGHRDPRRRTHARRPRARRNAPPPQSLARRQPPPHRRTPRPRRNRTGGRPLQPLTAEFARKGRQGRAKGAAPGPR